MSITSVEINLTNGGSHSATVSEDLNTTACGSAGSSIKSSVGGKISSGNSQIDKLLSDFLIESVTNSKDSRGKKAEFRLIDKYSEILNRYIILVRGITASPFASETYDGLVFGASEMPEKFFEGNGYGRSHSNRTAGKHGILTSKVKNGVFILGSSYSVVAGKAWEKVGNGKYQKTKMYSKMFQNDKEIAELSFGNTKIPPPTKKDDDEEDDKPPTELEQSVFTAADASVRYGYTAKEFFAAVKSAGVPINATGIDSYTNSIFEQSGTMADILSTIAAFYGYYWYIDVLGSAKGVTLIKSSDAHKKTVTNPAGLADSSILSYSYTTSNNSSFNVLSFAGDTESVKDRAISSGSITFDDKPRKANMYYVPVEDIYQSKFLEFYSFFTSPYKDSDDFFDKYFYLAWHGKDKIDAKRVSGERVSISKYVGSSAYPTSIREDNKEALKVMGESELKKIGVSKAATAYSINSEKKLPAVLPSKEKIYTILKGYFQFFGRLYISNGVSGSFKRRNVYVGSEGVSISGPYKGSLSIKEIPELATLVNMYKATETAIPTVAGLPNLGGSNSEKNGTKVLNKEGSYFFLGIKSENASTSENQDVFNFLEAPKIHDVGTSESWLFAEKSHVNLAASQIVASVNLFANRDKELKRKFKTLRAVVQEIDPSNITVEDGDEELPEEQAFDQKFFSVKTLGSPTVMTKASLLTYSGNTIEVKALAAASQASLGINSGPVSSASITYAGLKIPASQSILTDSISISLGSEGFSTTIGESSKLYLPIDQSLIINQKTVNKQKIPRFSAGAKNFFRLP
jgi:hypothetical protein